MPDSTYSIGDDLAELFLEKETADDEDAATTEKPRAGKGVCCLNGRPRPDIPRSECKAAGGRWSASGNC